MASRTVEVTASSLYKAVAQGLVAIRGNEWVAGIAQRLNVVKVSVADVRSSTSQANGLHDMEEPSQLIIVLKLTRDCQSLPDGFIIRCSITDGDRG
jgi:hypothetical protein